MGEFIDDIRQNPLVVAIGVVVFVIALILLHKKQATGSVTAPASVDSMFPPQDQGVVSPPITNVFNSYPVTTPPVQNQQPPVSLPIPQPTVHPAPGVITTIGGKWTGGTPLIPYGQLPPGVRNYTGDHLNYDNTDWTIVSGPDNRMWGVPGTMSGQEAANTPTKFLLYAPASYYTMGNSQ